MRLNWPWKKAWIIRDEELEIRNFHSMKLDLIIVGAQKAGTTSLNNYLRQHPDIGGHEAVEFSFFANKNEYERGFEAAFEKHFDKKEFKKLVAKNVTISLSEDSLPRLKAHNPDIKIVFLLREPVSRAYSAYTMAVKDGWINEPFSLLDDIIQNKDFNAPFFRHFIMQGHYSEQIERLSKHFPKENIHLYLFEDMRSHAQEICTDIFNILGLENQDIQKEIHNPTYKPRSGIIATAISKLRNENNPLKKVVKSILPYSLFSKAGNAVLKANLSNKKFDPIPDSSEQILKDYYAEKNSSLAKLKDEGFNIKTFSETNWIS